MTLERLSQAKRDLSKAYDETLEGWVYALDLKDEETEHHSHRVVELIEAHYYMISARWAYLILFC